jgi:CTP:molybdopterin cytidylyltransferase MocA/uncharacterized protein YndB with AHSA1/START domain
MRRPRTAPGLVLHAHHHLRRPDDGRHLAALDDAVTVCCVILAGGEGRRMGGRVKQLLPVGGRPLLQGAIDAAAAAGLDDLRIVLGHAAEDIAPALSLPAGAELIVNPAYAEGQSTSLRAGLAAAPEGSRAAVILLGDQPEVRVEAIRGVIDWFWVHGSIVVRAAYRGRPSHPVLLARQAWAGVEVLRGDVGARGLEATHLGRVDLAEVGGEPPEDIDTPEDYERLLARGLALRITRVLPAPPERVFDAFTTPERLAQWWGPRGFTAPGVELDPRPGGRYRILMQPPEGDAFHLTGAFREVERPGRLAFSFEWETPDPDDRPNLVTLDLRPLGDGTEVALEQRPFATEPRRALHRDGWTDSLDRLEAFLRGGRPAGG